MPERPRPEAGSNGDEPGVTSAASFLLLHHQDCGGKPPLRPGLALTLGKTEAGTLTAGFLLRPTASSSHWMVQIPPSRDPSPTPPPPLATATSTAVTSVPPRGALTPKVGRRDTRGSRGRSWETVLITPAVAAPEELHAQLSPPSAAEAPPTSGETRSKKERRLFSASKPVH